MVTILSPFIRLKMSVSYYFGFLVPYILKGVPVTLLVTFLSLLFGGLLGLFFAVYRVFGNRLQVKLIIIFSTVFRSIPQTVLLLILYFAVTGSINISPFGAAVFSLSLITCAYQIEIFRGAIQSVDAGQMMAARSLGMTQRKAIMKIILPQALKRALPAWANEVAGTMKASSLIYIVGIPEMLRRAQYEIARTRQPFPAYLTVAALYFIMISLINYGRRKFESKLK